MQEGVEVKDLILLARLHLSGDYLSGVGDSETSEGAKMPATPFVLELHLRHAFCSYCRMRISGRKLF